MIRHVVTRAAAALALAAVAGAAQGQEVVRHAIPGSTFPIARAVEIPAGATIVHLSGAVPSVTSETAEEGSRAAFGDTEAQTISVLQSIQGTLTDLGLEIGDVYRMQVFLVAPDGADGMDFAGFMEGYTTFFGTEAQPSLPVRSVVEVEGLANPAWLVEIEVSAVRSPVSD
jgi:enamine deaminase RidA (YjgF/YER057c/UK114 family)